MSDFLRSLFFAITAVVLSFFILAVIVNPRIPEPTAPYADVPGETRRLSYAVRGDSTKPNCIIWLHGLLSSRYEVLALDEGILKKLNAYVVSFDRPGYGESTLHSGRDYTSGVGDVAAVANSLNVSSFFVAGVSAGGAYALAAAALLPERVRGVLLLSAGGYSGLLSEEAFAVEEMRLRATGQGQLRKALAKYPIPLAAAKKLAETYVGGRALYSLWLQDFGRQIVAKLGEEDSKCVLRDRSSIYTLRVLPESMVQGTATPVVQDLWLQLRPWDFNATQIPERLGAATHIWHGTSDPQVSVQYAHAFKKLLPKSKLRIVDGGGHHAYWVCDKKLQQEALTNLVRGSLPP